MSQVPLSHACSDFYAYPPIKKFRDFKSTIYATLIAYGEQEPSEPKKSGFFAETALELV
jgi:hypothetical protein